jgi:hypothetical protein
MIPYLARLMDITMNNNAIPGDCKNNSGSHLQMGISTESWELKTGQLDLHGLQANGACYSRVPKTSLGNEWVVK